MRFPRRPGHFDNSDLSRDHRYLESILIQFKSVKDTCIIYYHGNDWSGVPARQRYLMSAIARHIPVIYLDQSRTKVGRVTSSNPQPDVTVIYGLVRMVYSMEARGFGTLVPSYVQWQLRHVRRKYQRIILWSAENWLRPHRFIPHDTFIYDCIDPCFSDDPVDLNAFNERERSLVRTANLVFASAEALVEKCNLYSENVALINNACEPGEYAAELLIDARRPSWWPQQSRPIAAYLGTLDCRLDFDFLDAACRQNSNVSFILAGQIAADSRARVEQLSKNPNVTIPGRISVEDGRFLLGHCAIGLIPFRMCAANDEVNPVKLYAYTLLGIPVVGSAVRELSIRPDVTLTARTSGDFAQLIPRAIALRADTRYRYTLTNFALENTWSHRAESAFEHIMRTVGNDPRPPSGKTKYCEDRNLAPSS